MTIDGGHEMLVVKRHMKVTIMMEMMKRSAGWWAGINSMKQQPVVPLYYFFRLPVAAVGFCKLLLVTGRKIVSSRSHGNG